MTHAINIFWPHPKPTAVNPHSELQALRWPPCKLENPKQRTQTCSHDMNILLASCAQTAIGHWGEMMFPLFSILKREPQFQWPPAQFVLLHLKKVRLAASDIEDTGNLYAIWHLHHSPWAAGGLCAQQGLLALTTGAPAGVGKSSDCNDLGSAAIQSPATADDAAGGGFCVGPNLYVPLSLAALLPCRMDPFSVVACNTTFACYWQDTRTVSRLAWI